MTIALFAVLMIVFMFLTVGFLIVANHSDTLNKALSMETTSSSKTLLFKTLEGVEGVRLYYPESYQGHGKYNGYIENTNLYPIRVHHVTEFNFLGEIGETIGRVYKLESGTRLLLNNISHRDEFRIFSGADLLGSIQG